MTDPVKGASAQQGSVDEADDATLSFDFPPASVPAGQLTLEWLETNGIGGWSSSTLAGNNTRRYHGLLVPALDPPLGRMVLLSRLDESVIEGTARTDLSSVRYPGVVHPEGWRLLRRFSRGIFPTAQFESLGWSIRKTVGCIHGQNTTVIEYELRGACAELTLELRPFLAGRDYHALGHANDFVRRNAGFESGVLSYRMYDGIPELLLAIPGAEWEPSPDWYYNFLYDAESERGLDDREDLFVPGVLRVTLRRGEPLAIVATIEEAAARGDGHELLARERVRRRALLAADEPRRAMHQQLLLAADQFIVRRGAQGRSVIAGYHWFGDWGRDTMIALPGLCLATGRHDDAKAILREFASVVSEGMLPNRFPDDGEAPEYNTVDATLWFFVAIHRTVEATGDAAFGAALLPVLEDIIAWHQRGTRHGIRIDEDGLLRAGAAGVQLTWMDAKVGDEVITPRNGKQVEINALWYNALRILATLRRSAGNQNGAADAELRAERVQERFLELFWNADGECLYDVVMGEAPDHEVRDASIRPNQIFAIALPFPLLEGETAAKVLSNVEKHLLTRNGLRTLSPTDARYAPAYRGGPEQRDRTYHQGTVWPWLLGPFITALVRVRGENGRTQARTILAGLEPHLREACIGGISEIFDAEPPFTPRGCVNQAWSVAEILRVAEGL